MVFAEVYDVKSHDDQATFFDYFFFFVESEIETGDERNDDRNTANITDNVGCNRRMFWADNWVFSPTKLQLNPH